MAKVVFAVAVLLCVGGALAQECPNFIESFSAVAFDTINFAPKQAYYTGTDGYLYFKDNGDDGALLFDFNQGVVYDKATDGSCIKYESDALKVSALGYETIAQATQEIARFTDSDGVTRVAKAVTNKNIVLRALFTSQCYVHFASWSFDNNVKFAHLYINPKALSADDVLVINSARQALESYSCTSQTL